MRAVLYGSAAVSFGSAPEPEEDWVSGWVVAHDGTVTMFAEYSNPDDGRYVGTSTIALAHVWVDWVRCFRSASFEEAFDTACARTDEWARTGKHRNV